MESASRNPNPGLCRRAAEGRPCAGQWLGACERCRQRPSSPAAASSPAPSRLSWLTGWWPGRGLRWPRSLLIWLGVALLGLWVVAEQRFPPPEFVETGHQLPPTTTPGPRGPAWAYIDVAVLAAFLGISTWLVHRSRSRRALFWLGIGSVLYFGFWRRGCICAIGSPQNVTLALCDPSYAVPFTVIMFFLLPLVVALFFGRTFCAAVCPHGALQDLVLVRSVALPAWLENGLGLLPYVFLGAGIWLASAGGPFLFCHYDPFVPLFRLNGRTAMVLTGAILLLLGTVVGRPYCRFACPYGALLKMVATLSKWRIRTTPNYCTQCRLCEASCPFGAMREPSTGRPEARALPAERRRFSWALAAWPLLILLGAWLGSRFAVPASHLHPHVALAETLVAQKDAPPLSGTLTPDELGLARARQAPAEILQRAATVRQRFIFGGWIFGGWVGLVAGWKFLRLHLRRARTDYEPDPGDCVGCARCFDYCPNELVRRGHLPASAVIPPPSGPRPG